MKKLVIGLDVDDVLLQCNEEALRLLNEKLGTNLSIRDIRTWEPQGGVIDQRLTSFSDPDFFRTQQPQPGAIEVVNDLLRRGHDIVFITAINRGMETIRTKRLAELFPLVPQENVVLTKRKDLCAVDVLLDDAAHNIMGSAAKVAVLLRRPWNAHITGVVSVNNYAEFLALITRLEDGAGCPPVEAAGKIVSLVGPSGSGKTAIAHWLRDNQNFGIPRSITTRKPRTGEDSNSYQFVSEEEFNRMLDSGEIFEHTVYAGNLYGSSKAAVQAIWASGKTAVMPIDFCGALALQAVFGNHAITAYIRRSRDFLIKEILSRDISNDDKFSRLISIEDEQKNAALCDFIIENNGSIESAAMQVIAGVAERSGLI